MIFQPSTRESRRLSLPYDLSQLVGRERDQSPESDDSGLKARGRVVVNVYLVLEPKTMSFLKERTIRWAWHADILSTTKLTRLREIDMIMLSLFNSRDREEKDWAMLFERASERYREVKSWVPDGASLAIIEAVWSG